MPATRPMASRLLPALYRRAADGGHLGARAARVAGRADLPPAPRRPRRRARSRSTSSARWSPAPSSSARARGPGGRQAHHARRPPAAPDLARRAAQPRSTSCAARCRSSARARRSRCRSTTTPTRQRGRLRGQAGDHRLGADPRARRRCRGRERIELDLYYVEHRSLALDLEILARTPAMLLGRKGIYKGEGGGWDITTDVPQRSGIEGRPPHRRRPALRHRVGLRRAHDRHRLRPQSARPRPVRRAGPGQRPAAQRRPRLRARAPGARRRARGRRRAAADRPRHRDPRRAREDGLLPAMVADRRSPAPRTTRSRRTRCSSRTACPRRRP